MPPPRLRSHAASAEFRHGGGAVSFGDGEGVLSFFSTTTVFGTPVDVTLSELALECFFPADPATAEAMRRIMPAG